MKLEKLAKTWVGKEEDLGVIRYFKAVTTNGDVFVIQIDSKEPFTEERLKSFFTKLKVEDIHHIQEIEEQEFYKESQNEQ